MPKVYLLHFCDDDAMDGFRVHGVYATEEAARAEIAKLGNPTHKYYGRDRKSCYIDEWEVE